MSRLWIPEMGGASNLWETPLLEAVDESSVVSKLRRPNWCDVLLLRGKQREAYEKIKGKHLKWKYELET